MKERREQYIYIYLHTCIQIFSIKEYISDHRYERTNMAAK